MSLENSEIRQRELPVEVAERIHYLVDISLAHMSRLPSLGAFYAHQARALALEHGHGTN